MKFKIYKKLYYKTLPQDFPEVGFVFTENSQVYLHMFTIAEKFSRIVPKTNVTCNRNQAGIRTDVNGNFYQNVFGLCTKKFQQNEYGKFVQQEGCFKEEDTELFKKCVNHCIKRIKDSEFKTVYFPEAIALSKSALIKPHAEYLKNILEQEFGFTAKVVPNTSLYCAGYGLRLYDKVPIYPSLL